MSISLRFGYDAFTYKTQKELSKGYILTSLSSRGLYSFYYKTIKGDSITCTHSMYQLSYQAGDEIEVLYNIEQPERAIPNIPEAIESVKNRWNSGIIFFIGACICFFQSYQVYKKSNL